LISFANDKERESRFKVFANNVKKIKDLNVKRPSTTFMINKFAHLSDDEFKNIYLNKQMPKELKVTKTSNILPDVPAKALASLPTQYDWRTHSPPVVTAVKDQGQCGSCWSFSTTGNIEGQWALAGHPLVSLSEQNLVDCDHTCIAGTCDQGCNGGLMANAFTYVIKNGGIDSDSSYPYQGYNGKCRFNAANVAAKIDNFTFIPKTADQMAYYLVNTGPVSIAADATMWQFYYSGVWYFPCGTSLDHGILIVGYGVETDIVGEKMPYWIVKNSWGASWGESGYIRLVRGSNECGIAQEPSYPVV